VISAEGLGVAVIVGIGCEHLAALGGTLESIALAKAGIIKDNRPVHFSSLGPHSLFLCILALKEIGPHSVRLHLLSARYFHFIMLVEIVKSCPAPTDVLVFGRLLLAHRGTHEFMILLRRWPLLKELLYLLYRD
jgi:hypothetical protein